MTNENQVLDLISKIESEDFNNYAGRLNNFIPWHEVKGLLEGFSWQDINNLSVEYLLDNQVFLLKDDEHMWVDEYVKPAYLGDNHYWNQARLLKRTPKFYIDITQLN